MEYTQEQKTTYKTIIKLLLVINAVLYVFLTITTIIGFKKHFTTNPKALLFTIFWISSTIFFLVGILTAICGQFLQAAKKIHLLISSWNFTIIPYLINYGFCYVSYAIHTKTLIITFFPARSVALTMSAVFALLLLFLSMTQLVLYRRIYSLGFAQESIVLGSIFSPVLFIAFEVSKMLSKYPHRAFQSIFLVFVTESTSTRNRVAHILILIVGTCLLVYLVATVFPTARLWKQREDEKDRRGLSTWGLFGYGGAPSVYPVTDSPKLTFTPPPAEDTVPYTAPSTTTSSSSSSEDTAPLARPPVLSKPFTIGGSLPTEGAAPPPLPALMKRSQRVLNAKKVAIIALVSAAGLLHFMYLRRGMQYTPNKRELLGTGHTTSITTTSRALSTFALTNTIISFTTYGIVLILFLFASVLLHSTVQALYPEYGAYHPTGIGKGKGKEKPQPPPQEQEPEQESTGYTSIDS